MTISNLLQIAWRWRWLIAATTIVAVVAVTINSMITPSQYESSVTLQFTMPQTEDVVLYSTTRSNSPLDTLLIARNNFAEGIRSAEVRRRTVEELDLRGADARYVIAVETIRDSDFVRVRVEGPTAEVAAAIANAHVNNAIFYYGEIRAMPATTSKTFFDEQLIDAEMRLRTTEEAFTAFKVEHNIADLERDIANTQQHISDLQSQRDREVVERPTSRTVERIDGLMTERRELLNGLLQLNRKYNEMESALEQARAEQKLLRNAITEARLKETTVRTANFIQVIEAAIAAETPRATNQTVLLVLGMFGGVGGGLLLALLLDALGRSGTTLLPRRTSAGGLAPVQQDGPKPSRTTV